MDLDSISVWIAHGYLIAVVVRNVRVVYDVPVFICVIHIYLSMDTIRCGMTKSGVCVCVFIYVLLYGLRSTDVASQYSRLRFPESFFPLSLHCIESALVLFISTHHGARQSQGLLQQRQQPA